MKTGRQIEDYFKLEFVGNTLEELDTPVPLVDLDIAENNILHWQSRCSAIGIANRPHIKTHKLVGFATWQLEKGAAGITVQKLGEAEVMASAGITDQLLTYNIMGQPKLNRLARLIETTDIKVVADNEDMLEGLSHAASAGRRDLTVLVECDTGMGRNGVQTPAEALTLAQRISSAGRLVFGGLMTYPKAGGRIASAAFLSEARDLLAKSGLDCSVISTGGTPDMWKDDGLSVANEYRAGTYIYGDRMQMAAGACTASDCALTVLATVVSRPTLERALLDAGTKSLTSDMSGLKGYGIVPGLGDALIYNANEEHGFLDISNLAQKPRIGDRVRILPNHACPISNLVDEVVLVRGSKVIGAVKVDARGKVT